MKIKGIRADLTAIHRKGISSPLKCIKGLIGQNKSILEYGCGHGFDFSHLKENGYNVIGYDKYIKTYSDDDYMQNKYDVIYCFYVLNVIADIEERKSILKEMKELLNKGGSIFIAVRSENEFKRFKGKYLEYGDGIVTSRNTFQKYFSVDDLFNLVRASIGECNIERIKTSNNTILLHIKP